MWIPKDRQAVEKKSEPGVKIVNENGTRGEDDTDLGIKYDDGIL